MVSKFKTIALAGALAFVATPVAVPAFAQDAGVPIVNQLPLVGQLPIVGNGDMGGMDLDPLHIFTPAPAAAPAAPMMKKRMSHHHMMMHHKTMMMDHKSMMMHHKTMMMHHKTMTKKS